MMWDSDQYWNKAKRYARRAADDGIDPWEIPFWSVLSLELLARSALTHIHPVLNADPQQEGRNIFYALGFPIKNQPRSIPIHAVLARLEQLLPTFEKPHRDFCDYFLILRNNELHTSNLAFEGFSESEWLPRYYQVCEILCESVDRSLEDLLGQSRANSASELIKALHSDKLTDVKNRISAHKKVFDEKPQDEQADLVGAQLSLAMIPLASATTTLCPACASTAKLSGDIESTSAPIFRDPELVVEETYLARRLECGACGLTLKDIEELHHAGVDPRFTVIQGTDLHMYFEPEYYEDYNNM